MRLKGEVLKRFQDKDTGEFYAPNGVVDVEEYTGKKKRYPSMYEAEKERYEELEAKGYVAKGEVVEDKRSKFRDEDERMVEDTWK